MRIVIIGSGIIGVTSAFALQERGHDVIVVDRQPDVARETSFANAGEVSPGYSSPWAAPGVPLKALRWMVEDHAPLILRPRLDLQLIGWMARFLRNCSRAHFIENKLRMMRLAAYSRERLEAISGALGIRYDEGRGGTLQLFRTRAQIAHADLDRHVLGQLGVPHDMLDPAGCVAAEPALEHVAAGISGGLRLPGDETGDCRLFAERLATVVSDRGGIFQFDTQVLSVEHDSRRVTGLDTSAGHLSADAYVFAAGSYTPRLARQIAGKLPVYPVKGYSLTADIIDVARAPVSTVLDESYKVAITRLGDRIRIGGLAELAGYDLRLHKARRRTLELSAGSLFAGAADYGAARLWTGLRPMTPDGTPIIGRSRLPNAFINCGHGTLGWTMACGSASLLADIVDERTPAVAAADYAPARYAA